MLSPSTCVLVATVALAQSEYSAFIVAVGNFRVAASAPVMATTSIQFEKQRCILWSMGEKQPTCRNDRFTQVSGAQPLPDGERAKWVCKARRGRIFDEIKIGTTTYDLADGRLFLVAGKPGDLKVLQLDRDPFTLGDFELMRLAKEHPDVREFFEK